MYNTTYSVLSPRVDTRSNNTGVEVNCLSYHSLLPWLALGSKTSLLDSTGSMSKSCNRFQGCILSQQQGIRGDENLRNRLAYHGILTQSIYQDLNY